MTTRPKTWLLLPLLGAASLAMSAEARADTGPAAGPAAGTAPTSAPAEAFRASSTPSPRARNVTGPDTWPASVRAVFIGFSGGVGYSNFKMSEMASTRLVAPMLSLQVGYRITPRWAVSVVYTDFARGVNRSSGGELFAAATSLLRPQLECAKCIREGGSGGSVVQTTFRLSTLGPAVDVTPFGKNGPFLGVAGGMSMASVTQTFWGVSGTARGGLRVQPTDNVSLGIEGGVQGQSYKGGSASLGYGSAELRLSF